MHLVRMQIACLLVLFYLTFYYFQKKRPAVTSTELLRVMLVAGVVNLLFDCIASFAIGFIYSVPLWLVRVLHQVFLGSLVLFAFFVSSYVLEQITTNEEQSAPLPQMVLWVPLGLSLLMVLAGPLSFQTASIVPYPFGLAVMAAQAGIIAFCGISLFALTKYRTRIPARQREALLPILVVTAVLALVQLIFPSVTLSGVSIVLMSLGIYLSLDNPDEYLTQTGNIFNRQAFTAVAEDWLRHGKRFTCVFVCYRECAMLEEKFGKEVIDALVMQLDKHITEKLNLPMYLPMNGCAAVLVSDEKQVLPTTAVLSMRFNTDWVVMDVPITLEADFYNFTMPDPYNNCDDLLNAVLEKANETQSSVITIDQKTGIKNRIAYDRDALQLYQGRKAYSSIHYFLADIVNLNGINKEHGHIEGDKLLQDCALVLQVAAGEGVDVYRMGGDEFGILLVSKTDSEMRGLLDRIQSEREKVNKVRKVPLDFAMGYSKFYADSDKTFSPMMTRAEYQLNSQKKHMKQKVDDDIVTTRLGTRLLKF